MMENWLGLIVIALIAPGLVLLITIVVGMATNRQRDDFPPGKDEKV